MNRLFCIAMFAFCAGFLSAQDVSWPEIGLDAQGKATFPTDSTAQALSDADFLNDVLHAGGGWEVRWIRKT